MKFPAITFSNFTKEREDSDEFVYSNTYVWLLPLHSVTLKEVCMQTLEQAAVDNTFWVLLEH